MDYKKALTILDLPDPPTPLQLKKSYRALALKYHPDRNPDKTVVHHFQECTAAYNYLLKNVDKWSHGTVSVQEKQAIVTDLEDIFDDIFGFSRDERVLGAQPPQTILLSQVQLAYGVELEDKLVAFEKCPNCQGAGASSGIRAAICTHCFGAGRITVYGDGEDSFRPCPKCQGRGRNTKDPCGRCDGFGRLRRVCRQRASIPAGLLPGQVYTVSSTDMRHGTRFDLFISPQLDSAFLTAEGSNLYSEWYLDRNLAKEGGQTPIPTLWGWETLTVPAGLTEDDRLVQRGAGLWKNVVKGQKGDWILSPRLVGAGAARRFSKKILSEMMEENRAYGESIKPWWKIW